MLQEQPCLVKQKSVGEWIVNKCHNCDMYTHATHVTHDTSRVIVNCSLKVSPRIPFLQVTISQKSDTRHILQLVIFFFTERPKYTGKIRDFSRLFAALQNCSSKPNR